MKTIQIELVESIDQGPDLYLFHILDDKGNVAVTKNLCFINQTVRRDCPALYQKWADLMEEIAVNLCKQEGLNLRIVRDPSMYRGSPYLQGNN